MKLVSRNKKSEAEVGAVAESQWTLDFVLELKNERAAVAIAALAVAIMTLGLELNTSETAILAEFDYVEFFQAAGARL